MKFDLILDDLLPVIQILENALKHRPTPQGLPHFDLESAISSASAYSYALQALTGKEHLRSQDLIELALGLKQGYHDLWERPFPIGFEEGQRLFSAMLERPMTQMIQEFKKMTSITSEAEHNYTPKITFEAEYETKMFLLWLDKMKYKYLSDNLYDDVEIYQERSQYNASPFGLGVAAFLFGFWLG